MPVYSFGAVTFGPRVSDAIPMIEPGPLAQGERHIPYSDYNVIDIGGRGARRYKASVKIAPADVVAFEALLGQTQQLTLNDVPYTAATLLGLTGHSVTPRGEFHWYEAEWVLVFA